MSLMIVLFQVIVSMPWLLSPKIKTDRTLSRGCGSLLGSNLFLGTNVFSDGSFDVDANANCPKLKPVISTAVTNDAENGRICSAGHKKVQIPFSSICGKSSSHLIDFDLKVLCIMLL